MASGAVHGTPLLLLRGEGLAVALASGVAFGSLGQSWLLFAGLFLLPDLSLLAYLAGSRLGAAAYDALHTYLAPILLFGAGAALGAPTGMAIALIWSAHIGFDRALGFGLKYGDGFGSTHLGTLGRPQKG
ncbi:DUF4260 family protein [Methylacidimicrobium sp. B4]|uniref:DUF4260 family protein n=1 Tax=Methylacidimicrobium sp. B4 TaxID=2796139 RepID=UPI001A8F869F|nr:DUF4260 family protein [Methylacidimicrobium sp. B4]QSR84705.1 DUF4260 family protein [Methylacidimicrobium sp. B4]